MKFFCELYYIILSKIFEEFFFEFFALFADGGSAAVFSVFRVGTFYSKNFEKN